MARLLLLWGLWGALAACSRGRDPGTDGDGDADADVDGDGDGDLDSDAIFAPDVLHEVILQIDPALFGQLDADHETRVPAIITYDGVRLADVGIRVKCGIGSCTTIADKAGFSLKFDEFVPDQKLAGLDKLVLNNSIQDTSYSNEMMGQELARRAGIPYKRVAHASVRLNGVPYGLFVVVEAVDKEFLRRHFGDDQDQGNLYEGECCGDFVGNPFFPVLKDEVEEGRSRDDVVAFSDFIAGTDDEAFAAGIDARMDLDGYYTSYAIDALVYHWDGYEYNTNNYFMYDRPEDGRFVFWLHGMDQLFGDCNWPIHSIGPGRIGQRVQQIRELREGFRTEIARILDDVWDTEALLDRLDTASGIYAEAGRRDPRHPLDEGRLNGVRQCLTARPGVVREQLSAVCGNEALESGEQCDDGNEDAHDGCSPVCLSECGNGALDGEEQCDDGNAWDGDGCSSVCQLEPGCGDGIVQGALFEECDDFANGDSFGDGCRDDCTANLCGDGRLDADEECDDGGVEDLDGCDASCVDEDGLATCGNDVLEAGEQCDDGNLEADDACDADCMRPCEGADASVVWDANGHCYQLFWGGLDWWTAEADCESRAGHLVTVGTDGEDHLLQSLGTGWLGLSDEAEEGSFGWVTGEPYVFDGFRPGEPNDWGGVEDCGVQDGAGWNDADCATAVSYFCEIE